MLGHKSGRITTHYSAAELENLVEAANRISDHKRQCSVLTLLKRVEDNGCKSNSDTSLFEKETFGEEVTKSNPHKIPTIKVVEKKRAVS